MRGRADLDLDQRTDGQRSHAPVGLSGVSAASNWSAALADDFSCHGTLTTMTPGEKSNRLFSRSALWLCRRCSHQWPTTYSGMNTVTTSRGLLRRIERT